MKRRKQFVAACMSVILGFSLIVGAGFNFVSATTSDGSKEASKAISAKLFEKVSAQTSKLNQNETVRVIVQLGNAGTKSGRSADSVGSDQQSVRNAIEAKLGQVKFRQSFSYLLSGFSLTCKRGDIPVIAAIPGVKDVREAVALRTNEASSNSMIGADKAQTDYGYKGTGTVVAVIDTGIDAVHSDMRLSTPTTAKIPTKAAADALISSKSLPGVWVSDKVPYGYNYGDNNTDSKALYGSSNHGMHVGGISSANTTKPGNDGAIGVAPESQVLAMKVFSNYEPTCWSDDTIRAIEDSVKLGADVINMSLGSTCGFTDVNDAYFRSIQAASDAGVVVCIAAGNDGASYSFAGTNSLAPLDFDKLLGDVNRQDLSVQGSPATQIEAISVASADNTTTAKSYLTAKPTGGAEAGMDVRVFAFEQAEPTAGRTFIDNTAVMLFDSKLGQTDADFSVGKAYGEGAGTPKWYALIRRGAISFKDKATNAKRNGASGVLIANNAPGEASFSMSAVEESGLSSFFISQSMGDKLLAYINEGTPQKSVNITVPPRGTTILVASDSTQMSSFTSWGPSENLAFKPEITAPGGNIRSTVNDEKYGVKSGTSMATPHVAGVVALIKEAMKGKPEFAKLSGVELVRYIKDTMTNTAQPITDASANAPYSPRVSGSGMVNVPRAIDNRVTATYSGKGVAALKQITGTTQFKVKLTNYSAQDQTFTVTPGNVYTTEVKNNIPVAKQLGMTLSSADATVTIPANGTKDVTFTFGGTAPTKMFAEGSILFASATDGQKGKQPSVRLAYMGYVGDWARDYRWADRPLTEQPFAMNDVYGTTQTEYTTALTVPLMYEGKLINVPSGNYIETNFADGNPGYKAETVGFNPTAEVSNNVTPQVWTFRNTPEIIGSVHGPDGNFVSSLGTAVNKRRLPFFQIDPNNMKDKAQRLSELAWDGRIYDPVTATSKPAPDGQYSIILQGAWNNLMTAKDEGKFFGEAIVMPVKIDTVAPTLELIGTPVYTSATDTLVAKVKSTDAGTGVFKGMFSAVYAVDGKYEYLKKIEATAEANDMYTLTIAEVSKQVRGTTLKPALEIFASDYAFNTSQPVKYTFDLVGDSLLKLKDGSFVGNSLAIGSADIAAKGATLAVNAASEPTFELPISLVTSSNFNFGGYTYVPFGGTAPVAVNEAMPASKVLDGKVNGIQNTIYDVKYGGSETNTPNLTKATKLLVDVTAPTITTDPAELKTNTKNQKYVQLKADGTASLNVTAKDNVNIPAAHDKDFTNLTVVLTKGARTDKKTQASGNSFAVKYDYTNADAYVSQKLQVYDAANNVATVDFVVIKATDDVENIPTGATQATASLSGSIKQLQAPFFTDYLMVGSQIKDGVIDVEGTANKVDKLTIAGKDVTIGSDGKWATQYTLKEGINEITFQATSALQIKVGARVFPNIYSTKVRIFWDKTAPTLVLNATPDKDADNTIWTKDGQVNLKGNISDNTHGSLLKINGNVVASYADYDKAGPEWNKIDFDHNVTMANKTYILVEAQDVAEFGNKIAPIKMQVMVDNAAPVITIAGPADGAKVKSTDKPNYAITITDNEDKAPVVAMTLDGKPYVSGTELAIGSHTLEVTATDKTGNVSKTTRTVTVYGAPTIDITGAMTTTDLGTTVDKAKLLAGVKATDQVDGDLTSKLEVLPDTLDTSTVGEKMVKYRVINGAGMMTEVTHKIAVLGEIKITGASNLEIELNAEFDALAGVEAYGRKGDKLPAASISVTGAVDTTKPGTYELTYKVTDMGVTKEFKRTITVSGTSTPDPVIPDLANVILRGYIDGKVKVFVSGSKENLNGAVRLVITRVNKTFTGYKTVAYECILLDKDGNKVEVKGPVNLYLHPEALDTNELELFAFFNPAGTDSLERLPITEIDRNGFVRLDIAHLSTYVLGNKVAAVTPTPTPGEPIDPTKPAPATGEKGETTAVLFIVLGLLAASCLVYNRRKKQI